jgi:hypothetical protein
MHAPASHSESLNGGDEDREVAPKKQEHQAHTNLQLQTRVTFVVPDDNMHT